MKKYEELWSKVRDFISFITKNSDDYDENKFKNQTLLEWWVTSK